MTLFSSLFLFISIVLKLGVHTINITISSSHSLPVKFGDKVIITCKLSEVSKTANVPVLFFNKGNMISEGCSAFNNANYELRCIKEKEYILQIKNVSWDEKGQWKCMYNQQTTSVNVDIYIPNKISILVNTIPGQITSPNLGPKFFPTKYESHIVPRGEGIPLNPYDLRNNLSVNVFCKSSCGYPTVFHTFTLNNSSNFSLELNEKYYKYESKICEKDKNTSSGISMLKLNCLQLKLYGLFNLTCRTFHLYPNEYRLNLSEESISILCPTDPIKWWQMTPGEMINTGIGCMIGLMLLMFLCLILCRWKSYKHKNNYDACQDDAGDSKIARGYKV